MSQQVTAPTWDAGVSLAEAKLSPLVRRRIEKVVLLDNLITEKDRQEDAEERAKAVLVRLGPGERKGLRVWGGDQNLCGKSNCSFWIFDPGDGSMLFAGNGYRLDFRSTMPMGFTTSRRRINWERRAESMTTTGSMGGSTNESGRWFTVRSGWGGREGRNRRSFGCGDCVAFAQDDKVCVRGRGGNRRSFGCGDCVAFAQDDDSWVGFACDDNFG
jgi:hypothetical protein